MKHSLLQPEIQEYINKQVLEMSVSNLALQKNPFPDHNWSDILHQIKSKQKAKDKLPTWFAHSNLLYPSGLSVEQTSSEPCAAYKAALVSGESLMDLTGGFGVDTYYFSKSFDRVTHCEMQADLSELVRHNFEQLNATKIDCIAGDSLEVLKELDRPWSCLYADPARRNAAKEKVFFLKDCSPNIPELLDDYFQYTSRVLIKTAPLLDLTAGMSELHSVKEVHVVALDNEVKELLWLMEKGFSGSPRLIAVNLTRGAIDPFEVSWDADEQATFAQPQTYLYEPNSAIMKTGKFNSICKQFAVNKLHQHSQLYTSEQLLDFPGRCFEIVDRFAFNKKNMKSQLEGKKAHVTIRNFPLSVSEIRKKWKVKDGGSDYYFFTTNLSNEKIILHCRKTTQL